ARTSKICRELNGRVFEVDRSLDYMDSVLQATDPESLKSLAPFVDGSNAGIHRLEKMSDEELQAAGVMVPPFHPNCRTILVMVGQAAEEEAPAYETEAEAEAARLEAAPEEAAAEAVPEAEVV